MKNLNNYFNETGAYEVLGKKLDKLVPTAGSVMQPKKNLKLEKYRKMVNAYYDLYNNGGGNPCRKTAYYFPKTITLARRNDWNAIIAITEPLMDKAILLAAEEQGIV